MRQTSFSFMYDLRTEFGGSLLQNKRKTKRPLSTKHPLHLILKSSHTRLFNPANQRLQRLIRDQSEKFHVIIYDFAVNWTHVHLLIQIKSRKDYVKFVRSLCSLIASKIYKAVPNLEKIFTLRPFTKIVTWRRQFKSALNYQIINKLESFGLIQRSRNKTVKKAYKRKESSLD